LRIYSDMPSTTEQALEIRDQVYSDTLQLRRPLRVFMMDLMAIVPYYDGHLCAAMAQENDLEVTLGAITYAYDRDYFRRQGVRNRPGLDIVARLRLPVPLRRAFKTVEATVNLAALVVRLAIRRPDVLHVQFLPMMEFGIPFERWMLRLARRLGTKVVHTVHNVLPPDTKGRRGATPHVKLYRNIYQSADALICHDERAKARVVREFSVRPERIRVIPHGPLFEQTCTVTREEARVKLRLSTTSCLVLLQGILELYKGVDFLLEAWCKVAAHSRDVRLAIVGNGTKEVRDSICRQVVDLGIASSVRLEPRFVSVEELGYWYRAADILAYPYREATTSGALMTGINFGRAIVATAASGFQQILRHGHNALLVNYGDVSGLADALRRLISDDALRIKLSERIRELQATGPRWPAIARQTRACYEELVYRGQNAISAP
jgi:glycosyltransferase involved in cell wall biosynthesis